jgi:hypothetical protein
LLSLSASVAAAQPRPGSVEIGGGGGRLYGGALARGSNAFFDQKVDVDDDIEKGFWVGTQLSRSWGIEVAVRRTSTHLIQPAGGVFPDEPTLATLDFATVDLAGIRSFVLGNFSPYLAFGAGVANLDINVPDRAIRDSNRVTLTGGAGGRFYFARWCGARVDMRARATYLGKRRLGEDRGAFDSGRWLTTAELLGGLFLTFGGK